MDEKTIWETYLPIHNPWFSSEPIYEGWGKASFEDPAGVVEGKTKITVNELGNMKIEMKYERLDTEVQINSNSETYRILKFLHRTFNSPADQVFIPIGTTNGHHCAKLSVQTDDGVFTSEGNIYWTTLELHDHIVFWFSRGSFSTENYRQPKYWVIPLINFTTAFHRNSHPLLTKHPLRQFQSPIVPDMDSEKEKQIAISASQTRNLLIGFHIGDEIGFIEPLPDYVERVEKLKSGQEKQCTTSLMIGDVTENTNAIWFSYQYISLLSFASGIEVGASWLETRDDIGKLIRREHFPSKKTAYEKGYAVIHEALNNDLSHLLSAASNSPEFNKTYFRVLISHLVDISSYFRNFENVMTILTRTIEGLSEELGFGRQNLITYVPETYQQNVKTILSEAKSKLERLSRQAKKDNLVEASASLHKIGSKVENASNIDGDFGIKMMDLLKWYKLPDAIIMEKYYSEFKDNERKSWTGFLSQLRNAPIHKGYFEMENGTYESSEIINTQDHLHDILVRIALKILNYESQYQPRVIDYLTDGKTVHWVTEESTVADLGYKRNHS